MTDGKPSDNSAWSYVEAHAQVLRLHGGLDREHYADHPETELGRVLRAARRRRLRRAIGLIVGALALYLILGGSAVGVGLVGILSAYHTSRPNCRPTWYKHERSCHYARVLSKK